MKDDTVVAYVQQIHEATKLLKHFSITRILRSENREVDALSKLASSSEDGKPKHIQWETLTERSIDPHEVLWLDKSSTWMDPIRMYLADGKLPPNSKEVNHVKRRENWLILYDGIIYKWSFTRLLPRCVNPTIGKKILEELHEGVRSSISGTAP